MRVAVVRCKCSSALEHVMQIVMHEGHAVERVEDQYTMHGRDLMDAADLIDVMRRPR